NYSDQIRQYTAEVGQLEAAQRDTQSRQSLEEHRLKEEQEKIIERRKQLTAIGGAKVAKMVEREIDIASRSMEAMEGAALIAVEEADRVQSALTEIKTKLDAVQQEFESALPQLETDLNQIKDKIVELTEERET